MHYYQQSDSSDDNGNDSDGSVENFLKPAAPVRKPAISSSQIVRS